MKKVKNEENGFNASELLLFLAMSIFAISIVLPSALELTSSGDGEYAYLSYNVKEEVQKFPALSGGDYKMVIDGEANAKADLDENGLEAKEDRDEFTRQLNQLESNLESQMKRNEGNIQNARPVVQHDQYQLISDNGLLKFVNYDGGEFEVLSPQDARDGLVSQKEIYDRTVTPIEKYLILHPNVLSEDIDIIVGNGERDMEVPASIKNEYEKFEEMLEGNLSRLIADGHLVDNPLINNDQYQFYSKDGEWELVNYDGEEVNFNKMKDQSADKISIEELSKYANKIEK